MLQSNYTARSGIIAQQERVDIIANNMANIATTGYKSVRADFKDMLYETMQRPVQPQDGLALERGHGVLLGATVKNFEQGTAQMTNNPLDFMLVGDGFFAVQGYEEGEILYTRDGTFAYSMNEEGTHLVTPSGAYVLDREGAPINLGDISNADVEVDTEGKVFLVTTVPGVDGAPPTTVYTEVAQLGIHTFMNRSGLEQTSGNMYVATENSGEATLEEIPITEVRQGMLEASNVDMAEEMTRLIRAQRSYSLASKALTTADEMDGKAISMRS